MESTTINFLPTGRSALLPRQWKSLSIQRHLEVIFLSFAQGVTGDVDIVPAAERLWVVVAAVANFLVSPLVRV